jgi:hypothetical protein
MVQDIRDENNNPIWCELGYWLVLDPLGKLVDSHQHMGETARRCCEGPNHVKTPTSKGPEWRYGDEIVGWNMRLLAEELTILAPAHEILRIGYCGGPPETVGHQKLALYAFPTSVLEVAWLPQTPSWISRSMLQPSSLVTHFMITPDRALRR